MDIFCTLILQEFETLPCCAVNPGAHYREGRLYLQSMHEEMWYSNQTPGNYGEIEACHETVHIRFKQFFVVNNFQVLFKSKHVYKYHVIANLTHVSMEIGKNIFDIKLHGFSVIALFTNWLTLPLDTTPSMIYKTCLPRCDSSISTLCTTIISGIEKLCIHVLLLGTVGRRFRVHSSVETTPELTKAQISSYRSPSIL